MSDHVGQVIKALRNQSGLSQRILGKRAGIPQTTVSRIEQGKHQPTQAQLAALMQALGYGAPRGVSVQAVRLAIIERTVNEVKTRKEQVVL